MCVNSWHAKEMRYVAQGAAKRSLTRKRATLAGGNVGIKGPSLIKPPEPRQVLLNRALPCAEEGIPEKEDHTWLDRMYRTPTGTQSFRVECSLAPLACNPPGHPHVAETLTPNKRGY